MNIEPKEKIGAGIKTISIITIVFYCIQLLYSVYALVFKDQLNSQLAQQGVNTTFSLNEIIVPIIFSVLMIVSIILILLKNTIGIFAYYIVYISSIIYTIFQSGFSTSILIGLILPVLMAIFLYQKRAIFKGKEII